MSDGDKGAGFLASLVAPDRRRYQCLKGHVTEGLFEVHVYGPNPSFPPEPEWRSRPLCRICWAERQCRDCDAFELPEPTP